ncbi:hypothetical protein [Streptomyces albicerus]|uniref:hypothetical protein n=1 Tax=Streptomyces albicerus TaxID=2569859 RepID=UPI00124B5440|nr:hypothetical protein [Streptomyces albicerus]
MYGHGAAPPPRSTATVISLRVLFAAAGFFTCGMLAAVPLFRVAMLRGKWFDWVLAWVSLPFAISCFAVIGSLPESDGRTDLALAAVMLFGVFSAAYFLVVDIRHHHARPPFPVYAPPGVPQAGYGYPQPASPYAATHPQSQSQPHLQSQPQPQPPEAPVPQSPVPPQGPPQRPAPARIDQVRAELDELSDYLRKHEDGR